MASRETLINIGSGASIHQFLSACKSFREIIAMDCADQNREEVQRWLRKEPGAFDWTLIVKYVCELEGDSEKWPEKEEKIRRALKRYLKCDVTQPNPLAPLVLPPADCLLSSLCFDGACRDIPTYRSAFRNISSLLKPGGHLLFYSTLELHYYIVGQQRFSNIYLEKEMVEEAVRQAGFYVNIKQLLWNTQTSPTVVMILLHKLGKTHGTRLLGRITPFLEGA
ncbi:nicotinamide N-methyltransferase-like [Ahaetulla prasina]|uniref:nicotinamide N-methyltransferase-like n=1 Tax=Ahaetulla prasina TaxID=499056 RepID=UPI0026492872|nr:nicotinamide N-methyltransferase-like [Ahaetulla prasina]